MKTNCFSKFSISCVSLLVVATLGCRGQKSSSPPIHPNLNMDFQSSLKTQEETSLFADKRAMRAEIPGTVPHVPNPIPNLSVAKNGESYVVDSPIPVTRALVERGEDRYKIYCTPCHGGAGYGDGIVVKRGGAKPPSYHEDRLLQMPAGQIFEAMSQGVRGNMPSFANKLVPEDRWAVVAYVRALQLSQNASLENVPEDVSRSKGWK